MQLRTLDGRENVQHYDLGGIITLLRSELTPDLKSSSRKYGERNENTGKSEDSEPFPLLEGRPPAEEDAPRYRLCSLRVGT